MSNDNDRINQISISIKGMLCHLSDSSSKQCIFKVHDRLRNHNKEAYEPQVLSIGPYHHGERHLKKMETYKLRYLQELLDRRGESSADRYIIALMKLEDQARKCYAEEISLRENDFVKMLCLDGIFIIEFLREKSTPKRHNKDDKFFEMEWLISTIERDLILFENQIPFFVLTKLFDMTKLDDGEDKLVKLALPVCEGPFNIDSSESCTPNEVIHLLDLRHKILCSSFDAMLKEIKDPETDDDLLHKSCYSSFDAILEKITGVKNKDPNNKFSSELKSASRLRQNGVKFESAQQHKSWLHITFENGKIKIPHLTVDDDTESIFRNLIAFEQYMTDSQSWKFVTHYALFLDSLINSPDDVEKLCHYGILTNWLGDDEVMATMFNKLVLGASFDPDKFCYSRVYKAVNKYASKRRNIWKSHLMRNYFNTPWSIISFLAAVVLLILTFVQTIFSILAVGKN